MIVIDTSAVVAVLLAEADSDRFEAALETSPRYCMSALNAHEAAVVLSRRKGVPSVDIVWQFLTINRIEIVPFDEASARTAAAAYDRYGKGIDSKARLNLADCAAYALAKSLDAPLLFKGQDFAHTDIRACV